MNDAGHASSDALGAKAAPATSLTPVLGQVVASRRAELKNLQGDLATKLGVHPETASEIESGKQDVSLDQVWRLAITLSDMAWSSSPS
jgi:DNA-binding XRE family transcriptional regulator